jgi:hypothetical protein
MQKLTTPLTLLCLLGTTATLTAQSVTLTSNEVLRIHFTLPAPPTPAPDVLQFGIGLLTVHAPYTARTARLWDGGTLLGTATSTSFGSHTGALFLGVCNSWCQAGSPWTFDSPGIVPSFTPLQNGTITGIIDFELQTGSFTMDLANVTMMLVQATGSGGGSVAFPTPVVLEAVVVPKLTGPSPGTVGAMNTWNTAGSPPGSLMAYAFGFGVSPILFPSAPPVFFDLTPPVVLFATVCDSFGQSAVSLQIPPTASGITLLAQVGELTWPALRVSNFSTHTFP